jgi:DnaJ-class molecular chaperone
MTPYGALLEVMTAAEQAYTLAPVQQDPVKRQQMIRVYLDKILVWARSGLEDGTSMATWDVCPRCSGSGVTKGSPRPDDHGHQMICQRCRGQGRVKPEEPEE